MSLDPQEVESLFDRAVQRQPGERASFLAEACGDDHALCQRVEELLLAGEAETGFLPEGSGLATSPPEIRQTKLSEEVGFQVDRYKLLEKLGEGGFGTVWAADQKEPVRRRVALKIIKLGMDTEQVVARFEAERQALALMDHPNIAKVLDAGTTETGRPYFVMELVKGMPITNYCDQEKLDTKARLDLFIKVCLAIQHAHQKGIIHRDIKPSNVMVTRHDGIPVPKVIDFGIAKATQADLTDKTIYTQYSQFIGTPAYMSPEQAEMSGLDVDTRADVYSLGVLFYELLTGSTPFDTKALINSGLDEMRKIIREQEPVRPSTRLSQTLNDATDNVVRELRPATLPSDLDWIVMKCLEKDRNRRYETASALAQDVTRHLKDETVLARPPSAIYRLQKTWRRNKLVFNAAAGVATALIVGLTLSLLLLNEAKRARKDTDTARVAEKKQKLAAQAEARRANEAELRERQQRHLVEEERLVARQQAYAADMLLCERALAANNLRQARQLLNRHRPKDGDNDLRGWEWRHLWQRCRSGALFELGRDQKRVLKVVYAKDAESALTYTDGGEVSRWSLPMRMKEAQLQGRTQTEKVLMSSSGYMSVSDDGEWIAAVGANHAGEFMVRIWESGRILVAELSIGTSLPTSLCMSPDKKSVAVFCPEADAATIWDIQSGEAKNVINAPPSDKNTYNYYGYVCYSPDGKSLAIGSKGRVHLANLESSSSQATEIKVSSGIKALTFSPNGRFLAIGCGYEDSRIVIWNIRMRTAVALLEEHSGFIADLTFSSDSQLLASASGDQTIKLWNTEDWSERTTLLGHTDEVWSVDFSPDGHNLMSSGKDGRILIWSLTGDFQNRGSQVLPFGFGNRFDGSPDGKALAAVDEGVVHLQGTAYSVPGDMGTNHVAVFWPSPDEMLLGTKSPPQIKTWNINSGKITAFPLESGDLDVKYVFLPLAGLIIAAVELPDNAVKIIRWDVATRRNVSSSVLPGIELDHVFVHGFSPDGHWLAALRPGCRVRICNIVGGEIEPEFRVRKTAYLHGMSLTAGGRHLIVSSYDTSELSVWDVKTREETRRLYGNNLVTLVPGISISPDGKRIMTGTNGNEPVKLWDTESWQQVGSLETLPGLDKGVLKFLSDGNTIGLLEKSFDSGKTTIRLWRAPTWQEINAVEAEEAAK
jgi:eukaryotic-like serine/threonine-protein kinase